MNGIREFARTRGATTTCLPSRVPDLRVADDELARGLDALDGRRGLFAYPAQSNLSGVQHPLEWIPRARERGWDVLLDAAAFAPTSRLDVARWGPDFVCVSFYKMFGYPTGLGCLIARRTALEKLRRPWFSGGTIVAVSVFGDWHRMAPAPEGFEDGTVDYLGLPAVTVGLRWLERVGIAAIQTRIEALGSWLLAQLAALRHSNGQPLVCVYGPRTWEARGGTITMNFRHPDGRIVDERLVDRIAAEHNVSLRTGCFCNPGGGEIAFELKPESLGNLHGMPVMTIDDYIEAIGLPSAGAVRVSLGIASNFADVQRFLELAASFRDLVPPPDDLPPRTGC